MGALALDVSSPLSRRRRARRRTTQPRPELFPRGALNSTHDVSAHLLSSIVTGSQGLVSLRRRCRPRSSLVRWRRQGHSRAVIHRRFLLRARCAYTARQARPSPCFDPACQGALRSGSQHASLRRAPRDRKGMCSHLFSSLLLSSPTIRLPGTNLEAEPCDVASLTTRDLDLGAIHLFFPMANAPVCAMRRTLSSCRLITSTLFRPRRRPSSVRLNTSPSRPRRGVKRAWPLYASFSPSPPLSLSTTRPPIRDHSRFTPVWSGPSPWSMVF